MLSIKLSKLSKYSFTRDLRWIGFINSRWIHYEVVVGLEVYVQLKTNTKLFSETEVQLSKANSNFACFDAGIPGILPVINVESVKKGIMAALALNCTINPISWFDRKHFFCHHMPLGYQITQKNSPIATNGCFEFGVCDYKNSKKSYLKKSEIKEIRLKTDIGRLVSKKGFESKMIDLNRAGNSLIKIIFAPDLRSSGEAVNLMKDLIIVLTTLEICSCDMKNGALKIDANVSVKLKNSQTLENKCKIKSINGIKSLQKAIDFEFARQKLLIHMGKPLHSEIRMWDGDNQRTISNQFIHVNHEYRYMPESNLPPLKLSFEENGDENSNRVNVSLLEKCMPELPRITRQKLIEKYRLSINKEPVLLKYFLAVAQNENEKNTKKIVEFLFDKFIFSLKIQNLSLKDCKASPIYFRELMDLYLNDSLNHKHVMYILQNLVIGKNISPIQIVKDNNWFQINDVNIIREHCRLAIQSNPIIFKCYHDSINESVKQRYLRDLCNVVQSHSSHTMNYRLTKKILLQMLNTKSENK